MSNPADSLARCVGEVDAFLSGHWGRQSLHRPAADPQSFGDLLSAGDVDHILSTMALRAPAFRLVKDGTPLPPSAYLRRARVGGRPIDDLIDVGRTYAAFADGATVVLQGLHRYWPPISRFCRDLELVLTHPVQANAYLTPPTNQGLQVHADTHDVFALQTLGAKQWVVYDGDTEPTDLTLRPGDCLYLPTGTRHAARTVEASSIHLTIGIRPDRWSTLLRQVLDQAAAEPVFGEALPPGYANDPDGLVTAVAGRLRELARWVEKLDPEAVSQKLGRRFTATRTPLLDGQLLDLLELDRLDDDTLLRRRDRTVHHLRRDGDDVVLTLGDRELRLPARVEQAVRAVLAADELRPADLSAHLDAAGRLVLTRRLVREGMLQIARG